MCDDSGSMAVTLIVGEESFVCNKAKLIEASDYFKAMFSLEMKESRQECVTLEDVAVCPFRLLLKHAQDGEISLDLENVLDVLQTASMLLFHKVIEKCSQFLMTRITVENCLPVMYMTETCGLHSLHQKSLNYALYEYKTLCDSQDLMRLPKNSLREYLSNDTLNVQNEIEVFRSVIQWVMYNTRDRQKYLDDLLVSVLRFSSFCPTDLQEIFNNEMVQKCERTKSVLNNCLETCPNNSNPSVTTRASNQLESRRLPLGVWIIGAMTEDSRLTDTVYHVLRFLPDRLNRGANNLTSVTKIPFQCDPTPTSAWGFKACAIDRWLYIFGGELTCKGGGRRWQNDIWCYDVFENSWQVRGSMQTPRRHHTLIGFNKQVYIIGGFSRHRIMQKLVERYDVNTGEWEVMPSLNQAEYSGAGTVCGGRLYVISTIIEAWRPGEPVWTQLTIPIPFAMGINQAATLKNKIYLTGTHMNYVYMMDPAANTCIKLGKMDQANGPSCVIHGLIYVVGGTSDRTIEIFNPANNTINTVAKVDYELPVKEFCVTVLPSYSTSHP